MKHLLLLFIMALFSIGSFALASQLKKTEPGNTKKKTSAKPNAAEKKINNNSSGKEHDNNNQKAKKDTTADATEFFGPLSWKPALLY